MRVLSPLPIVVLAVLTIGCGEVKVEPVPLEFKPGARRGVVQQSKSTFKFTVMNESFEMDYSEDLRITLDFDAPDVNGDVPFSVTYDYIEVEFGDSSFTEAAGAEGMRAIMRPLNGVLRALRKKQFRATLSPDGRVRDLQGLETVREAVLSELDPASIDPSLIGSDTFEELTDSMLDRERMARMIEDIVLRRPSEPLIPGAQWNDDQMFVSGFVDVHGKATYTVGETVNDYHVPVSFQMELSLDQEDVRALQASADTGAVRVDASGKASGAYQLDPRTGWPDSIKLDGNVVGSIQLGELPMRYQLRFSQKTETFAE